VAQNPDSRKLTRVASPFDQGEALRVAAIVAEASRTLWVQDASLAIPHIAALLVAEGVAARAVIEITDDGPALRGEARSASPPAGGTPVLVPILDRQRTIGSIAVDLPSDAPVTAAYVTALLENLAQFIGPAVTLHRDRAGERLRLTHENSRLQHRLRGRHDVTSIIGKSDVMRHVRDLVARAASADTPVLLEGEAGTGKEFLARTLHHSSPWSRRPFIEYGCSRAADADVEADLRELLRNRDAHARAPLADGGTLFLDDVHELSAAAQLELMRVLQQREFAADPRSSPRTPHVRVIAASETSLERAVAENRFRGDLFHRLSGFSIAVPRLRDRPADIPLLADFFVAKFACDHGKVANRVSARALELLTRYPWPGNVRELANAIERAVLLCDDEVVHGHHLSPAVLAADGARPASVSLSASLDAYEKDLLLDALRAARGVRSRAARLLQTTDRIFNYKVRKHGIDCRRFKG
jgi:Nif-specific regulatory protein